ncbi:MAG: PRC-barrel domain-containing protein [Tatlockia sp.]|nr:PRC-barrel domain-containing protein [Tatlockia sp.]
MTQQIVNSEDVVGVEVENTQGENLGKIEALMVDKSSGKVAYVVLSFGGFLGMGDKLFAMPWHIFSFNPEREKFIISLSKEKLQNSPGFDKDHWPDMTSSSWTNSIRDYYSDVR